MKQIEKMEADGSINDYVKQEQSMIRREAARLAKYFDGIRAMDKLPGRHVHRGYQARAQRRRRSPPAQNPGRRHCGYQLRPRPGTDFPIAGNDDAIRSVRIILATIGQAITQAQAEYEAKYAAPQAGRKRPPRSRPLRAMEPAPTAAGSDPCPHPEAGPGTRCLRRRIPSPLNAIVANANPLTRSALPRSVYS